jgi:hypothetical protein
MIKKIMIPKAKFILKNIGNGKIIYKAMNNPINPYIRYEFHLLLPEFDFLRVLYIAIGVLLSSKTSLT